MRKAVMRLGAVVLLLSLMLSLAACQKYPPIASTEEDQRTTVMVGKYQAPYELFRFAYLNAKHSEDNGNADYWKNKTEEEKQAAHDRYTRIAVEELVELYAVFAMAEEHGIDPDSESISKKVQDEIVLAIEGTKDGAYIGYGSYEKYQEALREMYATDAVFRLYMRRTVLQAELSRKLYVSGELAPASKETVVDYFLSDEVRCVLWVYVDHLNGRTAEETRAWAERALQEAQAAPTDVAFRAVAANRTLPVTGVSNEELENGIYVGPYQLDRYDAVLEEAIFELAPGQVSDLVETGEGYYIIRRMGKNEAYLRDESHYDALLNTYMTNRIGEMVNATATALWETVEYTAFYNTLTLERVRY